MFQFPLQPRNTFRATVDRLIAGLPTGGLVLGERTAVSSRTELEATLAEAAAGRSEPMTADDWTELRQAGTEAIRQRSGTSA